MGAHIKLTHLTRRLFNAVSRICACRWTRNSRRFRQALSRLPVRRR